MRTRLTAGRTHRTAYYIPYPRPATRAFPSAGWELRAAAARWQTLSGGPDWCQAAAVDAKIEELCRNIVISGCDCRPNDEPAIFAVLQVTNAGKFGSTASADCASC